MLLMQRQGGEKKDERPWELRFAQTHAGQHVLNLSEAETYCGHSMYRFKQVSL